MVNVSYNRLLKVPEELGNCEDLQRLELTGNHLSELPFEVRPDPAARRWISLWTLILL